MNEQAVVFRLLLVSVLGSRCVTTRALARITNTRVNREVTNGFVSCTTV